VTRALLVLGVLAALFVTFVVWRLYATVAGGRAAYRALAARIQPIEDRLVAGQAPDPADLERFAEARETRKVLYDRLEHHGKLDLFPAAYRTPEAMAEADLVAWLHHPNELAAVPDEIELMATLPVPGAASPGARYFLFRFRTKPPHWAASDGWMAGVAGPYPPAAPFTPHAAGTFSRFDAYDSRTPEEHVRLIHETTRGGG
jgi:hypothetical protein